GKDQKEKLVDDWRDVQGKHPDPLQALKDDPEIKKLTKERDDKRNELSKVVEEKEIEKLEEKLVALDEQIDTITKNFIQQGRLSKAVGEEYLRENERYGWRHGGDKEVPDPIPGQSEEERKKQIEQYQETRESKLARTKYFDVKEREDS